MTLAHTARAALQLSRSDFALLLGVSVRTVEAWEQRTREPNGAVTTLLELLIVEPAACERALLRLGVQPDCRDRAGRIERAIRGLAREWEELREAQRGEPSRLTPGRTP